MISEYYTCDDRSSFGHLFTILLANSGFEMLLSGRPKFQNRPVYMALNVRDSAIVQDLPHVGSTFGNTGVTMHIHALLENLTASSIQTHGTASY